MNNQINQFSVEQCGQYKPVVGPGQFRSLHVQGSPPSISGSMQWQNSPRNAEDIPASEGVEQVPFPSVAVPAAPHASAGQSALVAAPTLPIEAQQEAKGQDRKKKKHFLFIGSLLVILLVSGMSIWFTTKEAGDVILYQVGVQSTNQYIGGGGIIFPRQQLDVSYPVAERVVAVLIKAGEQVKPEQPLLQLDPSQLNAQIQQASDDMNAAQVYLNTVTLNGNPIAIAQAQQAYNLAKNKYNTLVAEASSPLLNKGRLISPMNGVVTAVNVNPGEVFPANTVLLTIMDESSIVVHMKVPLANFNAVHTGQSAIVTPSALPNVNVNGTVSAIIPQADPQTDTFEVWVEVSNPQRSLLPGMSAFVRIVVNERAYVLPRLAVLNADHAAMVFVVRSQHAFLQPVGVVGRSPDTVLVGTGVTKGDSVVMVGVNKLYNGQIVHIMRSGK